MEPVIEDIFDGAPGDVPRGDARREEERKEDIGVEEPAGAEENKDEAKDSVDVSDKIKLDNKDPIYGAQRPENIEDMVKKEKALAMYEVAIEREKIAELNENRNFIGRMRPEMLSEISGACRVCGSPLHSSINHFIATKKRRKVAKFNPKITIEQNKNRPFLKKFYSKKY